MLFQLGVGDLNVEVKSVTSQHLLDESQFDSTSWRFKPEGEPYNFVLIFSPNSGGQDFDDYVEFNNITDGPGSTDTLIYSALCNCLPMDRFDHGSLLDYIDSDDNYQMWAYGIRTVNPISEQELFNLIQPALISGLTI